MKGNNIFVNFLTLLEVKRTDTFSDQCFNEHPHKNNLYGLSKMLADYGVENAATRIEDKENDITEIQTTFITQFSGDFVAVSKAYAENVSFLWKGVNHVLAIVKFIEAWSDIVLLAESSEKSIEPDYKKLRKAELIDMMKKIALCTAYGMIAVLAYIYQSHYNNVGISVLLLINLAGLYISWLLLLKQMHIESQYADKICSLFKQKDCNNVLESDAAKLWGIISWNEIGFGYFLTNVLLLLFVPAMITYIALINILTLPYSFWSIWYQKVNAKQWCMLCLIVQVLLWFIFIIDLIFGYIRISELSFYRVTNLIVVVSCFFIAILGINILVLNLNTEKSIQTLRQSLNSMKANESIFTTLLKHQPFYETSDCDSVIHFGNPKSKRLLTVLTNPYCNPCALMHKRIEDLLQNVNNNISVQYILSSFGENLNTTNKYLIAACFDDKEYSVMQKLNDWFEKGKSLKDDYFKNLSLDMDNIEIEIEFQKNEVWKKKTQLRSTPTLLVNGYQLPDIFKKTIFINRII